jgi:hypothetical protein
MAADPTSIYKFRALERLDELTAQPKTRERFYRDALARLRRDDFDILAATAAGIEQVGSNGDTALDHFREHWLRGDFFPDVDERAIRERLRNGFRDAIVEAQQLDRPLNVIWVRSDGDGKGADFRVDHVVGTASVTIAIITPLPQGRARA